MAKIRFENGTVVDFAGNPTPQDVEEVARKLNLHKTPLAEPEKPKGLKAKVVGAAKAVGNALTSSEQTLGKGLSTVASPVARQQSERAAINLKDTAKILTAAHEELNPVRKKQLLDQVRSQVNDPTAEDINSGFGLTDKQIYGAAAGTALDVATAGSYGKAAKTAETGKLLVKGGGAVEKIATTVGIPTSQKVLNPVARQILEQTTSQALKQIAKKTAVKSAEGALTGYAYDVSNKLQDGKSVKDSLKPGAGAAVGGSVPLLAGAYEATKAVTKGLAPRIINSLVKPKDAQFAYGKNPGRTVSVMGITGNNLEDFGNNVTKAKETTGARIGKVYSSPANAGIRINATADLEKIDNAIAEAAKGGKNNQGIVTTLQNLKDALLYDHKVTAEGDIVRISDVPRDVSNLNTNATFDLKKQVAAATQFTGKHSDDKTVNATLKDIYGGLSDKLTSSVEKNNPEIRVLNERYGDLTSAEIAIKNRDKIVQRSNLISLPGAIEGSGAALAAAIISGGAAIPTILFGAGGVALDKALSSTPVRTRIAAWLGSESPSVIQKTLTPETRAILARQIPKFASKLNSSSNGN